MHIAFSCCVCVIIFFKRFHQRCKPSYCIFCNILSNKWIWIVVWHKSWHHYLHHLLMLRPISLHCKFHSNPCIFSSFSCHSIFVWFCIIIKGIKFFNPNSSLSHEKEDDFWQLCAKVEGVEKQSNILFFTSLEVSSPPWISFDLSSDCTNLAKDLMTTNVGMLS